MINKLSKSKVNSEALIIVFAIIAIEIGIIKPNIFIIPIMIVSFIFLIILSLKSNSETLMYMIIIILTQNIVCVIFSRYMNSTTMGIVIAYKEILTYLTIIVFILLKNGANYITKNKFLVMYIFSLLLGLVLSKADIFVRMISLRQLLIPVVTFIFGMAINIDENKVKRILKNIIYLGIIICVFGMIEVILLNDNFWVDMGIGKYMELKGFDQWVYNGLPGNYYTADFINITGSMYRRMVSTFTDPLLLSHFLALCLVILIFYRDLIKNKLQKNIIIIIMSICLIGTLSKGALVILAVAALIKYYNKNKYIFIALLIISSVALIFIIKTNLFYTVSQHSNGLIENFKNASLFGNGLGSTGNFAIIYSDTSADIGAGESYIGTLLGQIGIFGLICYTSFNFHIVNKLRSRKEYDLNIIVIILLVGMFLESILSESAISFIGSGLYFILAGIAYKISLKGVVVTSVKI